MDHHPAEIATGETALEDILGVAREDVHYAGRMYKGSAGIRHWDTASGL